MPFTLRTDPIPHHPFPIRVSPPSVFLSQAPPVDFLVRKKARFTHDMTFFHHDVRGKRFNAHGAKANFLSMPICSGIDHKNLRVVERLRDSKYARARTEGSSGPPHCVGPIPFREPMPAPPSVSIRAS